MADISRITLPNGNTYDIKDTWARSEIESLESIDNGVRLVGVTTTALTDGATTTTISINGSDKTAVKGDLVFVDNKEFLFDGTKWHLLDELATHGTLATKNKVKYDKTIGASLDSAPTFTGTSSAVTITATDNTSGNYQPKGTVSKPTFSGSSLTSTGSFTPEGTVTVTTNATSNKTATVSAASSGTATYTPAGTVSQPTFSNGSVSASGSYTPVGTIAFTNGNTTTTVSAASSGTTTYTPTGSVAAPTVSVATAGSTTTIKNPTSATVAKTVVAAAPGATAPSNAITYYSVSDETLSLYQLGYTTGASITTSNVTVKTGDATYTANAPEFTGTAVRLVTGNISRPTSATFSGTEGTIEVTGTATGTVSQPTFTGTGARLVTGNIPVPNTYTATFTGTAGDVSVTGTPAGTVSQPTFTGTKTQLAGTTTASGTISKPNITLAHTPTEATYE